MKLSLTQLDELAKKNGIKVSWDTDSQYDSLVDVSFDQLPEKSMAVSSMIKLIIGRAAASTMGIKA